MTLGKIYFFISFFKKTQYDWFASTGMTFGFPKGECLCGPG